MKDAHQTNYIINYEYMNSPHVYKGCVYLKIRKGVYIIHIVGKLANEQPKQNLTLSDCDLIKYISIMVNYDTMFSLFYLEALTVKKLLTLPSKP